jgi:AcrR family transcriptional regulator
MAGSSQRSVRQAGQDAAAASVLQPRRDARAHRAILRATRQLLGSKGYAKMTIESVAARAGVGKATIYRWWSSKGALALDVLMEMLDLGPAPDTGTTRGDLVAIVNGTNTGLAHPTAAAIIPGLATDLRHDPELAASFRDRFVHPRRDSVAQAIDRGVQRGDLPAHTDRDLLIDLLNSPVFYRVLITGKPVEADLAEKLVDFVLERKSQSDHL